MMVFWVIGAVAGLCVIVITAAVPELLAAALTAGAILGVYYPLQPNPERPYAMTVTSPETSPEQPGELVVTRHDDGTVTIDTPVPDYIQVAQSLWDQMVATGQDWYILEQQSGAEPDSAPVWVFNINLSNAAYRYSQVDSPLSGDGPVFHLEFQTSW